MKKISLLLSVILIFGCAGGLSIIEPEGEFQRTFEIISLSKSEIYTKSLQWIENTAIDSKEVIVFQDEEIGKIIGRGKSYIYYKPTSSNKYFKYTLTIDVKEHQVRITFSNFYSEDISGGSIMVDYFYKLEDKLEALSLDLSNYLKTFDEDW